jgi:aspartate/methionine/tyrosine aminotransferase
MSGVPSLSKRAHEVTASATMAITNRANELRAAGAHVIGFGAGEPDFATPDAIVEAAIVAARDPKSHRYSPAAGLPELRAAVADKTLRDSGFPVESNQVVITNGGKHAVYAALQTVVDPGDEVLLPAPYWVTYPEATALAGGKSVVLPTGAATGFQVTVDQLEAAVTERTRALIFVSPSNPTGAVYSAADVQAIGEWAVARGIWVITDEIYEHLVYGDVPFASLPVVVPAAAANTIVVNGVAKTYAMTGWRVGWLIGPPEAAGAAARLQSHMTSNVANVAQRAALAAVSGPLDDVYAMRDAFDRRRRTMHRMLNEVDGVECLEPAGAFYAFPSMKGLLDRDLDGARAATTMELAALLLDKIQIAIVPGEPFGAPGHARFSFALGDEDLSVGLQRLIDLAAG